MRSLLICLISTVQPTNKKKSKKKKKSKPQKKKKKKKKKHLRNGLLGVGFSEGEYVE